MRILKSSLSFLIFIFILACGQNSERQLRNENNDPPIVLSSEPEPVPEKYKPEGNLEVNDSTITKEGQAKNEAVIQGTVDDQSPSDTGTTGQNSGWNWWMIGAIVSIALNVILFGLLVKTIFSKDKYKEERDDIEIGKNQYKRKYLELLESQESFQSKTNSKNQSRENRFSPKSNVPKIPNVNASQFIDDDDDDEKPVEVALSVNNSGNKISEQQVKQPVSLFAEKATEDNTFTNVSDQKNEHKSIFKLILEDQNAETAQFEVMDSDFILKMAANSPDTYLYTVCKPENSNQNFAGEITTVKKGIAHKVDGKWQVKDENKATIKFQ